ncbi:tRNA (adenosine(37)-N6)-threonylcarbamoyltransferase complex ATPase subunit type 1 TsaE [Halobacteriovorax sp. ZH4_bin.1]|uniref:tRNA (adenosine(37)-N6)-threonylcarbamoyltransferase complex ATPase subunit type 1 TsaE n=1 Tax=unclassified Halobacteriovorax TaxID=2639665 RepID=UPI00371BB42D
MFDYQDVRHWKKVYQSDISNIIVELKESLSEPSVVILDGPVGAGKTTFTNVFLGEDKSGSPTYSLINDCGDIVHADFYRLDSAEEIIHLELAMYLDEKKYFLVEWGKDYIRDIYRELSDDFNYFQLSIETNDKKDDEENASRNYFLKKIIF